MSLTTKSLTTKRALAESLKRLLSRRSFDKITVKDIVKECGVNRQTFYYHFHDIYDLIDWIFQDAADNLVKEPVDYSDWAAGLEALVRYMQNNRLLILNVYHSVNPEVVNTYIKKHLRPYCQAFVSQQAQGLDFPVEKEDIQFVTEMVTLAAAGWTIKWIEQHMKTTDEAMEALKKLQIALDGAVRLMLRNLSGVSS